MTHANIATNASVSPYTIVIWHI